MRLSLAVLRAFGPVSLRWKAPRLPSLMLIRESASLDFVGPPCFGTPADLHLLVGWSGCCEDDPVGPTSLRDAADRLLAATGRDELSGRRLSPGTEEAGTWQARTFSHLRTWFGTPPTR